MRRQQRCDVELGGVHMLFDVMAREQNSRVRASNIIEMYDENYSGFSLAAARNVNAPPPHHSPNRQPWTECSDRKSILLQTCHALLLRIVSPPKNAFCRESTVLPFPNESFHRSFALDASAETFRCIESVIVFWALTSWRMCKHLWRNRHPRRSSCLVMDDVRHKRCSAQRTYAGTCFSHHNSAIVISGGVENKHARKMPQDQRNQSTSRQTNKPLSLWQTPDHHPRGT